jgi:glycosyltransferase involved in cell wall biosynthesis
MISIITINYNNICGLSKTVESVLPSIDFLHEWIIIDGGSSDGSIALIEALGRDYNRVKVVCEPDNGIYDAMNKGVKISSGYNLLFLNSGDTILSDTSLKIASKYCLNYPDHIICFPIVLIDGEDILPHRSLISPDNLLQRPAVPHQSTMIPKSAFTHLGLYDNQLELLGDYEFFLRCYLSKIPFLILSENPLSSFSYGGRSTQLKNISKMSAEILYIQKINRLKIDVKYIITLYIRYFSHAMLPKRLLKTVRKIFIW